MDQFRVVGTAVAIVVLVTAATGPLGPLAIPEEQSTQSLGEGNATVVVQSVPDRIPLERGRYGNDEYHLRVPDAEVTVSNLTGNPILNYNLAISELGTSQSSLHFLGEAGEGQMRVGMRERTLAAPEIEQDSYEARLKLVLRANDTERVLYNETATIEVEE